MSIPILTSLLGPRGAAIMQRFWTHGPATVREIHTWLTLDEPRAYTTTMTICVRLWEKGLLDRQLVGNAYRYMPKLTEAEFLRAANTPSSEPPESPKAPFAGVPHQLHNGSDRQTIEQLLAYIRALQEPGEQVVDDRVCDTIVALLERAESAERAVLMYQAEALQALHRAAAAERRALMAEGVSCQTEPQRGRAKPVPSAAVYEYPGSQKVCRVCGRPAPPPYGTRHDDLRVCSLDSCRQEARRRDNVAKQRRALARKRVQQG